MTIESSIILQSNPRPSSVHSLRCADEVWERAKERATAEGVSINHALTEIMEGYAHGLMDLPSAVKVFAPTHRTPKHRADR